MLDTILDYLHRPLVVLSGTAVTPLTLITALAIIVVARVSAAIVSRSLERVLAKRNVDKGLRFAIDKISRYTIGLLGLLVALGTIGIDMSAIMAGGAVLLVGIGFGLQKLAENFISGLLLLIERPVRKGDFIDAGGVAGTVEDIGWRATRVISRDGTAVIVPNSSLMSNTVINHSVGTQSRRIWVHTPVTIGEDLEKMTRLILEVANAESLVLQKPPPEVRHDGYHDLTIDLVLLVWIENPRDDLLVQSRLRFAIARSLHAAGIAFPIPQREIYMKSA